MSEFLNLNSMEWGEFILGEILTIEKCKCANVGKLNRGNISYVGATNRNNGVLDFVENKEKLTTKGNCIAFICDGEGSVGLSIYKNEDFIGSTTISIGRNKFLNKYNANFIVVCSNRMRGKYNYGYKRNEFHLKNERIFLPKDSQGQPNYEFMEKFMRQIEQKQIQIQLDYMNKKLVQVKHCDFNAVKWKEFVLEDIFEVSSPADRIDKSKLNKAKGAIPYISRTDRQNGIDDFVGVQERYRINAKNAITIGDNTQTAFYQSVDFYTAEHIQIIRNDKLNRHNALFILVFVKKMLSKFSWGNAATVARLKRSKILLPINSQGEPDYEFMENFMRAVEQKHLKKAMGYYSAKFN